MKAATNTNSAIEGVTAKAVFVVPSLSLACQQTQVLQHNLNLRICMASQRSVLSDTARRELADADVLVATHGAFKELLQHYGDLIQMRNFDLLILDECHHCTGSSDYVAIMEEYYHPLDRSDRPRVLGLTASPLINVRLQSTIPLLQRQVEELEQRMDANIVTIQDIAADEEEGDDSPLRKEATEVPVYYTSAGYNQFPADFPSKDMLKDAVDTRRKELNQLDDLYLNLGPYCVSIYANLMLNSMDRHVFQKETLEQFEKARIYLDSIVHFCEERSSNVLSGRTDKLLALEELLVDQLSQRVDAVGLVFVERRATAQALYEYFRQRLRAKDNSQTWRRASKLRVVSHADVQLSPSSEQAADERAAPYFQEVAVGRSDATTASGLTSLDSSQEGKVLGTAAPSALISAESTASQPPGETGADERPLKEPEEPSDDVKPVAQTALSVNSPDEEKNRDDVECPGGQFDDAESVDDISARPEILSPSSAYTVAKTVGVNLHGAVDTDIAPPARTPAPRVRFAEPPSSASEALEGPIRCGVLVRKPNTVFRRRPGQPLSEDEEKLIEQDLLEHEASIQSVLDSLRRREINILVATSIVEEGVDVRACSFVAAFDTITNNKRYVQMKGRARQQDSKLFVFDASSKGSTSNALAVLQNKEKVVRDFLSSRATTSNFRDWTNPFAARQGVGEDVDEIQAVDQGFYASAYGRVTLQSAKSLLYRFAQAQPMDPKALTSRDVLLAYLPEFDVLGRFIRLPAHIGLRSVRRVDLPLKYETLALKDRRRILALMACVRLHKCGLLSDRLLPLTIEDIRDRVTGITDIQMSESTDCVDSIDPHESEATLKVGSVFVYVVNQQCRPLEEFLAVNGGHGVRLAIVSRSPLSLPPTLELPHPQFGTAHLSLEHARECDCTTERLEIVLKFFELVFNARWKRKTRPEAFHVREDENPQSAGVPRYLVACADEDGRLLWGVMKQIVTEGGRSEKERADAALQASDKSPLRSPRIWYPQYDRNARYVVYGPSDDLCGAPFPQKKTGDGIQTYADYYRKRKRVDVPVTTRLFYGQQLWHLPSRRSQREPSNVRISEAAPSGQEAFLEPLIPVRLQKQAFVEHQMADARFLLLSTFLPQFLHHMERHLVATAFIIHCNKRFPQFYELLIKLPLSDVVTALSAPSCMESESYERLEWLGDAVLKLMLTDVTIKSTELRGLVCNLHEGNLDSIRSFLGSNKILEAKCKHLHIDSYILQDALSRGRWTPASMYLTADPATLPKRRTIRGKVCADVIEALLGLTFLHGQYDYALLVASELSLTIPWDEWTYGSGDDENREVSRGKELVSVVETLSGYRFERDFRLVVEAFTHPTSVNQSAPSYQKLEWIGDAVLCLATRQWIYASYPQAEAGIMTVLESAVVSNETLAFLSLQSDLHTHLTHCDPTLPRRLDEYVWSVERNGCGLWFTDPPKAIADIVESCIGAVHVHGGFKAGQATAERIVKPILALFQRFHCANPMSGVTELASALYHPRRKLVEAGGKLTCIKVGAEATCAREDPTAQAFERNSLRRLHPVSNAHVASIQCLGTTVVSVVDETPSAAVNRACVLVLNALENDPQLYDRFVEARTKAARAYKGQSNDEDDDYDSGAGGR